tara:strand:+ start:3577 stop:3831 length:255 start_codon:yes stop_codon:yes gene_type:complete
MIPASFAPMLLKLLMPKLMDHFTKVFKLDKVLNYVEQPNELDIETKKHREQIDMLAGELGMMENRLKKLEILNGKAKKLKKNAK